MTRCQFLCIRPIATFIANRPSVPAEELLYRLLSPFLLEAELVALLTSMAAERTQHNVHELLQAMSMSSLVVCGRVICSTVFRSTQKISFSVYFCLVFLLYI